MDCYAVGPTLGGGTAALFPDSTIVYPYCCLLYTSREVTFESKDAGNPAKFYFNSVTANRNYPDKKATKADAIVDEMGSLEGSNHRCINKMRSV